MIPTYTHISSLSSTAGVSTVSPSLVMAASLQVYFVLFILAVGVAFVTWHFRIWPHTASKYSFVELRLIKSLSFMDFRKHFDNNLDSAQGFSLIPSTKADILQSKSLCLQTIPVT